MEPFLKSSLSQEKAEQRFKMFDLINFDIQYEVQLTLNKGEDYDGFSSVRFGLNYISDELFIEFAGIAMEKMFLNNKALEPDHNYVKYRNNRFFHLPKEYLNIGQNILQTKFANIYSKNGQGLHSFKERDGSQYLYSQGETYYMNKIFPCFDQPDLKAFFSLRLTYPLEWIAISNEVPISQQAQFDYQERLTNTHQNIQFKTTQKISTYLFAIIAGEYKEIPCSKTVNNIQMSCFCRKSLVSEMAKLSDHIFDVTINGIQFYENYFGYKYPFSKHDHIFCPEFNSGAMENVGAITYNDTTVLNKDELTTEKISKLSRTILHELAHMWFGNLVTMKWWNDLWLNESFADFIAYFCCFKIQDQLKIKLQNSWLAFFQRKGWGYREDQMKTTHPITCTVINTEQAKSIFDGISYSKGGAVLYQLMNIIGEENFSKSLHLYFNKFQWQSTKLEDFIKCLDINYQPLYNDAPTLENWKNEWLETAGLNEIEPSWTLTSQDNIEIIIMQRPATKFCQYLRHHQINIALFDSQGKVFDEIKLIIPNEAQYKFEHKIKSSPIAILLNYNDHSFVKVKMDTKSMIGLQPHLGKITSELTKSLIWRSLFDMVRDAQLSPYKFISIAKQSIQQEKSDQVLSLIIEYCSTSNSFAPNALTRNYLSPYLFDSIYKRLINTDASEKLTVAILRRGLIEFATYSKEKEIDNISILFRWLKGECEELKNIKLETSNLWSIVGKAQNSTRLTDEEKRLLFQTVAEIDRSQSMIIAETKFESMNADKGRRKVLWQSFLNPAKTKLSEVLLEASMNGYKQSTHHSKEDHDQFFEVIVDIFKTCSSSFAKRFFRVFYPGGENFEYQLKKIYEILPDAQGDDWLPKLLNEKIELIERKRKTYLCSAPDLLALSFGIKYQFLLHSLIDQIYLEASLAQYQG